MTKISLKEYLLFNRNILIGFVGAFLTGAAISQAIAGFTSALVNSIISVVAELGVFLSIFGVLFYFDNKDKFIDEKGKRRESGKVKWILIKLASTLSVAEIEYNTVKPAIHFWLLTLDYQPFIASTIASVIAIVGYLAVADSMAYLTRLFKKP
jgi:predicted Kef-type K+ transport protein